LGLAGQRPLDHLVDGDVVGDPLLQPVVIEQHGLVADLLRGADLQQLGPLHHPHLDEFLAIEQLVDLMEERYKILEAAQVADVGEYNEQATAGQQLERRVLVIDEFQDLITEKATAQAFFTGIKRLGAKARAAGIHLILATQRPDRDTVPPIIKANLGGKIALQVASKVNSRIVLDDGGAEKLLGKGDLLASLGRGIVRAQAPLLSER